MRDLDPHDHPWMLADPHGGQPRVHVREILFDRTAFHARADDVEERKDTCPGAIDHLLLESGKVSPSRAAHVDERCLSAAERMTVRRNGRIAVAEV